MLEKIKSYLILILLTAIIALLTVAGLKKRFYDKQVVTLQNQAAALSKTVEDQKGLYEKLALQETDLSTMLDKANLQTKELASQLKKSGEDLQSAVEISVQLKQALTAQVAATQTIVQPAKVGDQERTKVAFDKDFGTFKVSGYTLTNPGEADLSVTPGAPLKLTVAMSQDKNKAWHAYATSSDPNVGVNIDLAAVNPYVQAPKWYEHIGLDIDAAGGQQGALGGIGLSYKFGKFEAGPKVYATVTDKVDAFYGASFVWHPFASDN